jgi:hypothetical protein
VPKPFRWLFNSLTILSILLWLAIAGLWLIANQGIGSRVFCIATPGSTLWRIRLDDPFRARLSRFTHWPLPMPGFAMRYVANPLQPFVFSVASSIASVQLAPPSRDYAGENFSYLSGPATFPPISPGTPPKWDAIVIAVRSPTFAPPSSITTPTNMSLCMVSLSYVWAIEILSILPLIKIAILVRQRVRKTIRAKPGFCATCGYDLRATPDRCPECGEVPPIFPKQ